MAALCVARLVDQKLLRYDDLVTKFWPEFGKNGKENITVRWLLGHRTPNWPPGTETGYHALTYGWLVDQIIRRVDPKHRSVGVYFKEEFVQKYSK
ncbi:hypothetical protein ANCDUO_17835 [Ancylostoma duodenale]|uniref:Beta-lactamase-related domain-containing protein n=1 Tax=Ancylostoma duodenale TaxID=51022 RepID=A0A0C2FZG8_9BILA|nr:hypothetical protein ANCDUO_17835 [Ancylostoma duodenale]